MNEYKYDWMNEGKSFSLPDIKEMKMGLYLQLQKSEIQAELETCKEFGIQPSEIKQYKKISKPEAWYRNP